VGFAGALWTFGSWSDRLHNDVRNIHEVQRAMGEELARRAPPDAWVAASDAGAVRYFSRRPVVDVIGLNTPELYWEPGWAADHPVEYLALMPALFALPEQAALRHISRFRTRDYSVTSTPEMAWQDVYTCTEPALVELRGRKNVAIRCGPSVAQSRRAAIR
jgi:hypothetical protein